MRWLNVISRCCKSLRRLQACTLIDPARSNRVYVTVWCMSVRGEAGRRCRWIAVAGDGIAARRSAANASDVTLSADAESWRQTYYIKSLIQAALPLQHTYEQCWVLRSIIRRLLKPFDALCIDWQLWTVRGSHMTKYFATCYCRLHFSFFSCQTTGAKYQRISCKRFSFCDSGHNLWTCPIYSSGKRASQICSSKVIFVLIVIVWKHTQTLTADQLHYPYHQSKKSDYMYI